MNANLPGFLPTVCISPNPTSSLSSPSLRSLSRYFWGSLLYEYAGRDPIAQAFNEMSYNLTSLAASDFYDAANETMANIQAITQAAPDLKIVLTNVNMSRHDTLRQLPTEEYHVLMAGGTRKVGFISLLGKSVADSGKLPVNVTLDDSGLSTENVARRTIAKMKREHPDLNIIALMLDNSVDFDTSFALRLQGVDILMMSSAPTDQSVLTTNIYGEPVYISATRAAGAIIGELKVGTLRLSCHSLPHCIAPRLRPPAGLPLRTIFYR